MLLVKNTLGRNYIGEETQYSGVSVKVIFFWYSIRWEFEWGQINSSLREVWVSTLEVLLIW